LTDVTIDDPTITTNQTPRKILAEGKMRKEEKLAERRERLVSLVDAVGYKGIKIGMTKGHIKRFNVCRYSDVCCEKRDWKCGFSYLGTNSTY